MCAKFYLNRMVRFQNRRNRTRWTSDVFWIMRSAIGTLPGLARTTVGHNTAPDHLARDVRASFDKDLSYVVEGHASACPQTVCVDVKCVALTLIKLKYDVSASIMKCNIQFELL